MRSSRFAVFLVLAGVLSAAWAADTDLSARSAYDLYRRGRLAERAGQVVQAYLYYSEAAAMQPENKEYYLRSQALRTRAAMAAKPEISKEPLDTTEETPEGPLPVFNIEDLREIRDIRPPKDLKLPAGEKDYDLRGNMRSLWEQAARDWGFGVAFDKDFSNNPGETTRIRLERVTPQVLMRSLSAATNAFVIPISDRMFMVAQDSPQKRQELEQVMAVAVPIPETVTVQETQELARSVQQTMEIQKFAIDGNRRMVLIRDRVSKVRSALILFDQLMRSKADVELDIEFLEVGKSSSLNYGVQLPTQLSLVNFGKILNSTPLIPTGLTRFLTFGGGKTFLGLGLTDAGIFAQATESDSRQILRSTLRTTEGQAVTFKIGDKYPIITQGYYGNVSGTGQVYSPPPTFNYEDLGLTLKITPRVHGTDEMTLELESDFKVLGAQSINDIPIVSQRRFVSTVSLRQGEWAIVAGLVTASQARTLSGLAGVSNVPVLGPLTSVNTRDKSSGELLLIIKPRLLSLPASELMTREFYTGTETRPISPL